MLIQQPVDLVFRGAADSRRIPYSSRFVHDVSGKFKICLKRQVRTVDISQIMGHSPGGDVSLAVTTQEMMEHFGSGMSR